MEAKVWKPKSRSGIEEHGKKYDEVEVGTVGEMVKRNTPIAKAKSSDRYAILEAGIEDERGIQKEVDNFDMKNTTASSKSSNSNRFAILDTDEEAVCNLEEEKAAEKDAMLIMPRKARVASAGVAELMKTLKPKTKGPIDKGKLKQNKAVLTVLGGQTSTSL